MHDDLMEDGRHCIASLTIRGRAFDASFLEFVADRARRFSLDGWTARPRADEIRIVAAGPNALIDMLEVACMLGPVEALVDEIVRQDEAAGEVAAGRFEIVAGTTFATGT
jgi:acylphosphatase